MTNPKKFRIKKEIHFGRTRYYPQKKFLFWWLDIFKNDYHDGSFFTFEQAQENLCDYIAETTVEYLDFECECGEN